MNKDQFWNAKTSSSVSINLVRHSMLPLWDNASCPRCNTAN